MTTGCRMPSRRGAAGACARSRRPAPPAVSPLQVGFRHLENMSSASSRLVRVQLSSPQQLAEVPRGLQNLLASTPVPLLAVAQSKGTRHPSQRRSGASTRCSSWRVS